VGSSSRAAAAQQVEQVAGVHGLGSPHSRRQGVVGVGVVVVEDTTARRGAARWDRARAKQWAGPGEVL
jgi:hypothetical protein